MTEAGAACPPAWRREKRGKARVSASGWLLRGFWDVFCVVR